MKKRYMLVRMILTCIVSGGFSGQANANESLGVSAQIGTLGGGAEVSLSLLKDTRLRAGFNYFDFSLDGESNDIDYDFDTELRTFSLLLDYHPFGGAFFFSGGAYLNNNEVGVAGHFESGEVPGALSPFLEVATVRSDVEFNTIAPYLGFGWRSNNTASGWAVACDFGVMFQGAPDVTNTRVDAPVDVNSIPEVQAYLANEEEEIEDDLSWFEYYPVATIKLVYHF